MWSSNVLKHRLSAVAILLTGASCVLLAPFLFGNQILLYKDIGSDSVNEEWPLFVLLSDYLRAVGIPSWSFQFGLGQSLYPYVGHLLFNPVVWLPRGAIPSALAWQHLLRMVLAGLLFFRFLELRGLNFRGALGGAMFLALSGYLTLGSGWSIVANELVVFAFVLYAVERALQRGSWIYLPVAVALFGLISVFHLYLCALLIGGYVTLRAVEDPAWAVSRLTGRLAKFAGIFLLGAGLSAIVALDLADAIAHSPRGSGTAAYANTLMASPVSGLHSAQHYATAIARHFSTDLIGTGSDYRGWSNYFEAPATYCGLLCLLLFPQAVVFASPRQRWLIGGVVALLILPVVFPWLRYLFWAFQGDYYRTFSLFTVFAVVTLAATALARYAANARPSLIVLGSTMAILLGILWWPMGELHALIVPSLRMAATVFLLGYGALLAVGFFLKRQALFASLLLGLSLVELISLDRITIAHRPTVTKTELQTRAGYNDHTVEALRDVKAREAGFYRLTKTYSSGPAEHASLNDSMIFGFFGTSAYSSFNALSYVQFLIALDLIAPQPEESETRWLPGLAQRPILSTFAGEKYLLTREPIAAVDGGAYDSLQQHEDIYLYQNNLSLPLGLAYTHYLPEERFHQLTTEAKDLALLHAVVLTPDLAVATVLPAITEPELERATSLRSIMPGIRHRRESAFRLRSFRPNHIEGTLNAPAASVLVFQTPFDRGWRAWIDRARVPAHKVDFGLLGVAVAGGEHTVELRYTPRFFYVGAALSLLSAVVLLVAWRRWPRLS